MSTKGLRQTRLSFAPLPKKDTHTSSTRNDSASAATPTTESPSKTPKPKRANGRSRGNALECVEIPPPPKRSSRIHARSKATPTISSPAKQNARTTVATPTQARKPSLKRKLSPAPDSDNEGAEVLRALELSESSRSTRNKERSPPKKIRLSSPESDLTPLPSSSAFCADPEELVPTSQSDEQELTLPRIPKRDAAAVQESVAKWREDTHANPPSRAQSPPPLDPIRTSFDDEEPMEVDGVASLRLSTGRPSTRLPYPQTPRSSSDGSSHQACIDATPATAAEPAVLVATPTRSRPSAVSVASPSEAFSSLTPPPSSDPISGPELEEEPQVIQALDVKSKTEKLIADIKARALAAAHSSPEQSMLDLSALSDPDSDSDSSDDGLGPRGGLAVALSKGVKGMPGTKACVDSCMHIAEAPTLTSYCVYSAVTPSRGGPQPAEAETSSTSRYNLRRISPNSAKPAVPMLTQQRKPRKSDPLDALLREKAREERTGTGMVAIRDAEEAYAASRAKESLKDEMADEESSSSDGDWDAELASLGPAARGIRKGKSARATARGRPHKSTGSDDEEELAGIDCEAILGSKGGKAVGKILQRDIKDKKARALAKLHEEPIGVPLWSATPELEVTNEGMDVDSSLPPLTAGSEGNSVMQLLGSAINSNDSAQVSALLAAGCITCLQSSQLQTLVSWLFDVAFADICPTLSRLAYTQLMRIPSLPEMRPPGLRPSSVLSALVRLGAPASMLCNYGWTVPSQQPSKLASNSAWRDEMVYRLVTLVGAFTHSSMGNDLLEIFLAILLVGMDPMTSEELLTEVRKVCDRISIAIEVAQGDTLELEAALCEKIVAFGKPLSPANQERLVSIFPCISSSTTRMARNVSRALLMVTATSPRSYEKLPDLSPVLDLVAPPAGSGGYFDIAGHSDKEGYYDALTCRVSLLSRVLSDIDAYTALEIQAAKEHAAREKERLASEHLESQEDKIEEKDDRESLPVLERIRIQLEELHGKIFDTKAAHLDRSRAKASLQRLYSRVHYQRLATLKSRSGNGRPRNLHGYFSGAVKKS
ncbi:hypothetical protein GY45DRAFT_1358674 [Cubamyces sp. BRFM 1775]|nr:hypothetical protein GY45DRAFT_1358674 [Cubamyces sp. BRFM 1775]